MGSYGISVSLGTGCYRHIQISQKASLFRLHEAILEAFEFEDDHAHAFFMDNKTWSPYDAYFSLKMDGHERLTKGRKLEKLNLKKRSQFKYVFDFGDEWRFQCKVLRELEEDTKTPLVIREVGESPEQYPEWEEYEDEDDVPDSLTQEEMEELYGQIPLTWEEIDRIHQYMDAAAHLYGLVSLDELFSQSARGLQLRQRLAPENQLSFFEEPHRKPKLTIVGVPSRNGLCPCGSGRKYKNCCGKEKQ